jgi:aminoglycoside 2'-N-acetyltransferase I
VPAATELPGPPGTAEVFRQAGSVPALRAFGTSEATGPLLAAVRRLLERAFAGDFSDEDWAHTLGGRHFVTSDGDEVLAHAAVVPRVLEVAGRPFATGYVEGVATTPPRRGRGLGSEVMAEATAYLRTAYELGALSTSRHAFYERLGWERWQGPTYVRRDGQVVRTQDEDDGVMVLRFGPSADVDRTDSITCEGRPGDDW